MDFASVSLEQIDINDSLFYVRNENESKIDPGGLSTIFNPIWLQEKKTGSFRIIDGFLQTRLIVDNSEIKNLPARIFNPEHEIEDLWLLRVQKRQIEQNLAPFALLESLVVLLKYLGLEEPAVEIRSMLVQLGYPEGELNQSQLQEKLAKLKQYCRFCDLYSLTYREIHSLSRRKPPELNSFTRLFKGLNLKGNKLQSMLQMLEELAKGYGISPEDILSMEETKSILTDSPDHLRYKTLKTFLSKLRWPMLDRTQKKWQQSIKKFNLKGKLEISIDPWFEGNQIDFLLKASTIVEFKDLLSTLEKAATTPEFAALFDFV